MTLCHKVTGVWVFFDLQCICICASNMTISLLVTFNPFCLTVRLPTFTLEGQSVCTNNIWLTVLQYCMMSGWQISVNQRYMHNAIYQNWAFAYNRSTMFLKSAKFQIMYNFFLNPYNVFDITTFNRTKYVLSFIIHKVLLFVCFYGCLKGCILFYIA